MRTEYVSQLSISGHASDLPMVANKIAPLYVSYPCCTPSFALHTLSTSGEHISIGYRKSQSWGERLLRCEKERRLGPDDSRSSPLPCRSLELILGDQLFRQMNQVKPRNDRPVSTYSAYGVGNMEYVMNYCCKYRGARRGCCWD